LAPFEPVLLNLVLNHTVFIDTILDQRQAAIDEAKGALKSVSDVVATDGARVVPSEAFRIIERMQNNAEIWTKQGGCETDKLVEA